MNLIVMGPQGVGKGAQSDDLAGIYGIPHISTGEIFRKNIAEKTELGKKVSSYIEKGELVPDEVTSAMVFDRLSQPDARKGWILDGYPRNARQSEALDEWLSKHGERLDAVILLEADADTIARRIQKRIREEGRSDDNPDAIAERLAIYARETKPLIDYYSQKGLLRRVNAEGSVPKVTAAMREAIEK
ncbi:MAG: adenylate kinase [Aeriscardovia sp.]|nr:adenylate kinase [Aeriscardovia sp.]